MFTWIFIELQSNKMQFCEAKFQYFFQDVGSSSDFKLCLDYSILSLIMKSVITNFCLKNYNSWKFSWYFTCFTFTSHILHFFYLFSRSTVLKIVQIRYLFLLWKSKKDQDWWLQVLWLLSLGWLHEKLWSCVHQLHFQSVCTSSAPALKKLRPKFRQNGLTHTANIQVTDKKLLNV